MQPVICSELHALQLDAVCCLLSLRTSAECCSTTETPWSVGGAPGVAGQNRSSTLLVRLLHPSWLSRQERLGLGHAACCQTFSLLYYSGLNMGLNPEPGFMLSLPWMNDGLQVSGLSSVLDPAISLELWMLILSWFWDSCDVLLTF